MATFADLQFEPHSGVAGVRATHEFPNGYKASVVRGEYTYGGQRGLYELAVIHGGEIVYDTPITNDVLGYLTEDEVTEQLAKIAELPARVAA